VVGGFPPIPTDYKEVDDLNTIAGLKQPIYDLIVEDPPWAAQAMETITALVGDGADLPDLIVRLELSRISAPPPSDALPRRIPVEVHTAEDFTAEYRALPSEYRHRREAKLQDAYEKYLTGMNHKVSRHQIPNRGYLRLARACRSGVHHADLCARAERRLEGGCGHFAEGCDTHVTLSHPSNTIATAAGPRNAGREHFSGDPPVRIELFWRPWPGG
jgi:hypothetical protein